MRFDIKIVGLAVATSLIAMVHSIIKYFREFTDGRLEIVGVGFSASLLWFSIL